MTKAMRHSKKPRMIPDFYERLEELKPTFGEMYERHRKWLLTDFYWALLELLDQKWGELEGWQYEVLKFNFPEVYAHCQRVHDQLWHG